MAEKKPLFKPRKTLCEVKNSIIGNQRSLMRAQNIQDYVSATVHHTHHFGYDPSASDDNSLKKVGDKSKMHF